MTTYPLMLALELALGLVAGFLFRDDDSRAIRPRMLVAAVSVGVAVTLLLIAGWLLRILPFDLPVDGWYSLMIWMGIYEGSAFLLAALLFPWAPRRTRAKATLAVLAGALVLGHLTYGGGDLSLGLDLTERLIHFAVATVFAAGAAAIGNVIRRCASSQATS